MHRIYTDYIYIYHHISFILWENVIITVDFDVFSGRCWDNSGEFFQEVASAQQQNWIQLRRMMRQQGRYHCGWWPMVKLSRSKRCVARHGSLSAGDKRVEYQWIASRNQRWKWNSTRSEFRDYCPIFSMYIFLYFPVFSYIFLYVPLTYGVFHGCWCIFLPFVLTALRIDARPLPLIAAVKTQEDADSVPEPTGDGQTVCYHGGHLIHRVYEQVVELVSILKKC